MITSDVVGMDGATTSVLESTLWRRARRLGLTINELREADRQSFFETSYPTAECLDPFEVERFFCLAFPAERLLHVEECAMCSSLLEVAQPNEMKLDEFIGAVKSNTQAAAASQTRKPIWRPLIGVTAVELPIMLAMLIGAVFALDFKDIITENALVQFAPMLGGVLAAVLMASLAITVVGDRLGLPGQFGIKSIGTPIGLAAACIAAPYMIGAVENVATISAQVAAAQRNLVESIAKKEQAGVKYSDSLYTASVGGDRGTVVAERANGPFRIYLEGAGVRRPLARVYQGNFQQGSEEESSIKTGSNVLGVSSTAKTNDIYNGETVLAVVPINKSLVSSLYPLRQGER